MTKTKFYNDFDLVALPSEVEEHEADGWEVRQITKAGGMVAVVYYRPDELVGATYNDYTDRET